MSSAAAGALARLRAANPRLGLFDAGAPEFREFGRVLEEPRAADLVQWMSLNVPMGDSVVYQRSVGAMEDLPGPGGRSWKQWASSRFFGGQSAQVGYVAGRNLALNAFEYHKSSELLVAGTPLVLLLGRMSELEVFSRFDSSRAMGFLAPAGTVLELYATSLHFSPIMAEPGGFRAAIVLPLGTNSPLEGVDAGAPGEDGLLRAERKWLLACPGTKPASLGARVGMDNVELVPA